MTSLYEVLKAQKMGAAIAPDYFTALWAGATGGGEQWEVIEYTGAVPVEITANGEPLIDLIISGNMQQSGTPSSTTPIQPQECGERTGNIFTDTGANSGYLTSDGVVHSPHANLMYTDYIEIPTGAEYLTQSFIMALDLMDSPSMCFYDSTKNFISGESFSRANPKTFEVPQSAKYLRTCYRNAYTNIMLNSGSTALPYEPYGYKLDISSGGENLFDEVYPDLEQGQAVKYKPVYVGDGNFTLSTDYPLVQAGTADLFLLPGNVSSGASTGSNGVYFGQSRTFSSVDGYMTIGYRKYSATHPLLSDYHVMLNLGSTAKPYSPYNRTTTPVYLGEVPTTRKVKKLVLTGEETISGDINYSRFFFSISDMRGEGTRLTKLYCTHYQNISDGRPVGQVPDNSIYTGGGTDSQKVFIKTTDYTTVADFKAYLASEYSAGHPVTVWYVLATEQTGILNEPIRKIGDYADTISMEQAGVSIPTVSGVNVVDVDTTLKPSEITIKYKGRSSE